MNIISYEQRISKMIKLGDEDIQLQRAKNYIRRLRRKSIKAPSLKLKLEMQTKVKEAEKVLRKLRQNIFALEDQLNQTK